MTVARPFKAVSKLEFLFMFFFVLVRVISWIIRYATKKNDPRNQTNRHEKQPVQIRPG
jgi:hypothetical protein